VNILMTGGTGLIGSAFIARYTDYNFTVLTRSIRSAKKLLPASVTLIESLDQLKDLDNFDAVINLAGEPIIDTRWSNNQKEIISQSRWKVTEHLVSLFASSKSPPKVFLSGSAIGVYGNRDEELLTESSEIQRGDFPTALCYRWEELALQAKSSTRVVLLRTGIVLSAEGGALSKMLMPFKFFLGGRVSHGEQYMAWIHYQDHIAAMNYLLTATNLFGPVNLVAPHPEKNKNFTKLLAKTLERFAVLPMPEKALMLVLGESSCLLLGSQRVVPKALMDDGFTFSYPDLKLALRDLLK